MEEILLNQDDVRKLLYERRERLKELSAINQTVAILREDRTLESMLTEIASILPQAWQYTEHTVARIVFDDIEYASPFFRESDYSQRRTFHTINNKQGFIEVAYTIEFPEIDEGPFLKEERDLINNLAIIISGFLNTLFGKNVLKSNKDEDSTSDSSKKSINIMNTRLLQKFINKHNSDRDIYHELMKFRVREVLLVATLYDAFIIEKEGRFFERVTDEYYQLNLSSAPRITAVSSAEESLEKMQFQYYDLVIIMMGIDKTTPIQLSKIIKQIYPGTPIFLLMNNDKDIAYLAEENINTESIDKIFVWNGDSKVFLAILKHLEDYKNIERDTHIGLVRVILLVEDSAKYYSRYMPTLYSIVIEQTQRLIEDSLNDEFFKLLRMRVRPKILLATNYEEATEIIENYKDYLLCLITDIKYKKDGKLDELAGIQLAKFAKSKIQDLPVLLQSSESTYARYAYDMECVFINKNSDTLVQELKSFINNYLGFGNFVFKDSKGNPITVARSMNDFMQALHNIPDDSLIFHGRRNDFSNWLMSRGEIKIAKLLKPAKVQDFPNYKEMREYILYLISNYFKEKNRGKTVDFFEDEIDDETTIVSLANGSLGGKGRGIAFINTIIYTFDFSQIISEMTITSPKTFIIGSDEFERFLDNNDFHDLVSRESDYDKIKSLFVDGHLSHTLRSRLRILLYKVTKPLAVRSSSLFEDSLQQPFSGIFDTFLVPNNEEDFEMRIQQLESSIKLVFASLYSPTARKYFESINYRVEDEKMAVVIQEVVGKQYGRYFYPHISGVAQSYNYYPFAHQKPEDGYAVIALGLGKYVVEGNKTFRFSPKYPKLEILSTKDILKSSQVEFFALDMESAQPNLISGDEATLATLDLYEAEQHGTLKHLVSVYNSNNDSIVSGMDQAGPRILNFANILKYDYIPLAKTIELILETFKEALGAPVEIEFAIDLNKSIDQLPKFYLLQIKPIVMKDDDYNIELESLNKENLLLLTEKGMGNGLVDNITDVIYVDLEKFDKTKTMEMAIEIDKLNTLLKAENRKYILIGPGRWGTRDKWIGIPVSWAHISNAKVIVETSLDNFPLDASLGSHFFHNVTSMKVGYFSVQHNSSFDFINFDILEKQQLIRETEYFKHVRFESPVRIIMDGKKRIAAIEIS